MNAVTLKLPPVCTHGGVKVNRLPKMAMPLIFTTVLLRVHLPPTTLHRGALVERGSYALDV
eukprot:1178094-Prorocentrum_minimum.AAC.4